MKRLNNTENNDNAKNIDGVASAEPSEEDAPVRRIKNPHRKKRKRKSDGARFRIGYIIFVSILAAGLVAGLLVFADFIRVYEKSLPEHVVESYVDSLDGEAFSALIRDRLAEIGSGFETADDVGDMLRQELSAGVNFTESIGAIGAIGDADSADAPRYDVYCGGRLMTITLSEKKRGRYGFAEYEIGSAEVCDEWLDARISDVVVYVPATASLTVNGFPVGESYLTGDDYDSATLSVFERGSEKLVKYAIGKIFGTVRVAAEHDGAELKFSTFRDSDGKDAYYSDFDLSTRADYMIKAPADASVTVNGVLATADFITATERVGGESNEFEPNTSPELSIYTIPALVAKPEVKVTLDGGELLPDETTANGCAYSYPESYRRHFIVKVPRGTTLYCNGIEVGSEYKVKDGGGVYDAPNEAAGVTSSQRYETYDIGLYGTPTLTLSAEGAALEHADGTYEYTFYPTPSSAVKREITEISETFTRLFVKYSYEGTQYTQQNFDNVMAYVVDGSAADKVISPTLSSMIYNSNFKVDKLEMTVRDIAQFSDDCVSVKVDFDSHGKYYRYEKSGAGTYSMVWVKRSGEWRLVGFKM